MNSLWDEKEAGRCASELELRAWTSRLLGSEKALVMYGGGNTSVKLREDGEGILYVKGSGSDLARVTKENFAPLRLEAVKKLIGRDALDNAQMAAEFRAALKNPDSPRPSIEAILHAILPFKWVEHTHADAVLAVADTRHGEQHLKAAYGDSVLIVPYRHSGFELAKACHDIFTREATPSTIGMVLMHHGVFAFGGTARESYGRMIALVSRAEDYLKSRHAWDIPLRFPSSSPLPLPPARSVPARFPLLRSDHGEKGGGPGWGSDGGNTPIPTFPLAPAGSVPTRFPPLCGDHGEKGGRRNDMLALAALRRDISLAAGFPVVTTVSSDLLSLAFSRRPDLASLSRRGPATPQHAVFTKRLPMLGCDVAGFVKGYREYLAGNAPADATRLPDPAPRIVLDPEWGLIAAGVNAFYADAAAEIYRHSMKIQARAEALEQYVSLPPREVLAAEIEYGGFERAVRSKDALAGQVVLVGSALANRGKVQALLDQGAAVAGLDADPAVASLHLRPGYLGLVCDTSDHDQIKATLARAVRRFGGIDLLVSAGETLSAACRPLLELSPAIMLVKGKRP
ncbi:MAG: class II aldolase/adducin family protein [Sulfuricella sp.]